MRSSPLLLVTLPGWVWGYLSPAPLSSRHPKHRSTPPADGGSFRLRPETESFPTKSHAQRCRPLFRKGFSKGGMGKQGELMEQMAKAQRDRKQRELEEKLRESGDLPPKDEAPKPSTATGSGRIKPDRSWREAGVAKAPSLDSKAAAPAAPARPQPQRAGSSAGGTKTPAAAAGMGGKVWPSTREEGRSGAEYNEYEQLLESTGDHSGSRKSPEVENPKAAYKDWDSMRDQAQWDAVIAGKKPVRNRSPVASETEYSDFEAMLSGGARLSANSLGLQAAEKKIAKRVEKKAQLAFSRGDFAPLDPWRTLSDMEGEKVNFGLFRGTKPLLVVAEPNPGSGEMKQALYELNTRMPRKLVDVVAVTVDTPAANRKLAKKSRIQFPVLSDEAREWMLAYRVTQGGLRDNMAFLIEPDLGRRFRNEGGEGARKMCHVPGCCCRALLGVNKIHVSYLYHAQDASEVNEPLKLQRVILAFRSDPPPYPPISKLHISAA
ncbi:unnamed protein product [Pylaiella littoralis]